ncbi:hypothetical protein JHW43_007330 [Diplocarpon mali]|nr:hypothetical protein JHW43_007330 [Diplocarpon mali]
MVSWRYFKKAGRKRSLVGDASSIAQQLEKFVLHETALSGETSSFTEKEGTDAKIIEDHNLENSSVLRQIIKMPRRFNSKKQARELYEATHAMLDNPALPPSITTTAGYVYMNSSPLPSSSTSTQQAPEEQAASEAGLESRKRTKTPAQIAREKKVNKKLKMAAGKAQKEEAARKQMIEDEIELTKEFEAAMLIKAASDAEKRKAKLAAPATRAEGKKLAAQKSADDKRAEEQLKAETKKLKTDRDAATDNELRKRFADDLSDRGNHERIKELDSRKMRQSTSNSWTQEDKNLTGALPFDDTAPWPPFEIRSSPLHGLGAFATRFIKSGTEVLREYPMMKGNRDGLAKEALFKVMSEEKQARFLALEGPCRCTVLPCTETPVIKILNANYLCHPLLLRDDFYSGPYLYELGTRLNHSCEEFTLSYLHIEGTAAQRRVKILEQDGFVCKCQVCISDTTIGPSDIVELESSKSALLSTAFTASPALNRLTAEECAQNKKVDEWFLLIKGYILLFVEALRDDILSTGSAGMNDMELTTLRNKKCVNIALDVLRKRNKFGIGEDAIQAYGIRLSANTNQPLKMKAANGAHKLTPNDC